MLTYLFRFLDPALITSDLPLRLRRLADDCERLQVHRSVSQQVLQNAPLLENWMPTLTAEGLHLVGRASSHPILGDSSVMATQLWWADPEGMWARSLSRFYRLGPPAECEDLRRVQALLH